MRDVDLSADSREFTWFPIDGPPKSGQTVVVDKWWVTHPEKGLPVFRGCSPQCNDNEAITRHLAEMYDWAEVRFVPVAFVSYGGKV